MRVLHELHTTMKTYHSYQAELRQAEAKLKSAETQRSKLEQTLSQDKLDRSKKYKLMEKEVMKVIRRFTYPIGCLFWNIFFSSARKNTQMQN